MGTKFQCKSFSPLYHSMRDPNDNANVNGGSWPSYSENIISKNEQYYNYFLPRSRMDAYPEHDKLKQTMIEHETLFRSQVSDLHRLYRTQRDLMHELKWKELHKDQRPMEGSQTSPSSRQNGCISKENGSLQSKSKQVPRRLFDLQLPANEYLERDGEQIEEEKASHSSAARNSLWRNYGGSPKIDVNLSLSSSTNPIREGGTSKSGSCIWNRHRSGYLDQPVRGEGTPTPTATVNIRRTATCQIEVQDSPAKPKHPSMPTEFFRSPQKDKNTGFNIIDLCLENERKKQVPYNLEAGRTRANFDSFCQGFNAGKLPTPFASAHIDFRGDHERPTFSVSDYKKRESDRERAVRGTEIPESSNSFNNFNYSGPVAGTQMSCSYPGFPHSEDNSGSPSIPSWLTSIGNCDEKSTVVKDYPCFHSSSSFRKSSESSVKNPVNFENILHLDKNSRLTSTSTREISSGNVFPLDFLNSSINDHSVTKRLELGSPSKYFRGSVCTDVKSRKCMDLNLDLPNRFQNGRSPHNDLVIIDGEAKNEDPPQGLPWLQARLACEAGSTKGKESTATGNSQASSIFKNLASAFPTEIENPNMGGCRDNRKILSFPNFDNSCISKEQRSKYYSEVKEIKNNGNVCRIDLSREPAETEIGWKLSEENPGELGIKRSGFRRNINLNLCVDEEEISPTPDIPNSPVKVRAEIDLEAPLAPETPEGFPHGVDNLVNQLEGPVQSSATRKDPLEELEIMASEAIVFMSASNNAGSFAYTSSEESLKESLNWFADIVSSEIASVRKSEPEVVIRDGKDSSDESDYFESMTLKLTEAKLDELSHENWVHEIQNEEDIGNASCVTRRRRGQSRRGRQKRDFQKDILPGLVSLSRHEVTEDLQAFGGIMKAAGHPWQSGNTRRCKNGLTRGRKLTQEHPAPVVLCSLPREQQPSGIEEISLKGWGKTTRRPRRQRFPAATALPSTKV